MSPLVQSIFLQLLGIGVIIAEIILPSGGLLSLLAISILGYSLYVVFHDVSVSIGYLFVAADVVMLPILVIVGLKLLAKSPVTLRKKLSKEEGVVSQVSELEKYLGKTGESATDLHPGGTAIINGKRIDVVSRGDYIEKGTQIEVWKVTGNQLIVRKKE